MTRTFCTCASALLGAATLTVARAEPAMRTEAWDNSRQGIASCEQRIAHLHGRNLLARSGARLIDGPACGYGEAVQLTDGKAGAYLGRGRVLPSGNPAVFTYYLGRACVIRQAGVFTFNSDTRANQRFEVRFGKSVAELPGVKPDFSEAAALSTGSLVLGTNAGGFHTCFRAKDGGNLTREPVDWVEFRVWPTLGANAGALVQPKKQYGPSALVELEVLGAEAGPTWEPEEAFFSEAAQVDQAVTRGYRKLGTWHQSLQEAREALEPKLRGSREAAARLWECVERDFSDPVCRAEIGREREDRIWEKPWVSGDFKDLAKRYAAACRAHPAIHQEARQLAGAATTLDGLAAVRAHYHRSCRLREILEETEPVNWGALRLAVQDLIASFGARYLGGEGYLNRIREAERRWEQVAKPETAVSDEDVDRIERTRREAAQLRREALLANPLLDFEELLLVRRREDQLGMPANWQSNSSLPRTGYENEIARLPIRQPDQKPKTVFRPAHGEFVGDVDLHFDAGRLLCSMPADQGAGDWQVFEMGIDGGGLRNVTGSMGPGIHNYDACYLPDGGIAFTSTAGMAAVPCVRGSSLVATLFRMNADGTGVRQLCFDQEHSWSPALMHDGRLLYTRWEYADLPHAHSRMLFTTNPDGTSQRAYYGSGSFWPNSIFHARPVPGHPTMVAGTVTGHHAPARMGELVLFDPARGAYEADGVVQRIPGHGQKVEPVIQDGLTRDSWPKFLHPYPLNERYLLVSAKPSPDKPWGLYLADVFDNLQLIREEPGYALLEPVPLRRTPRPPVIPDRTDPERKDALMLVSDIHAGPGLAGIPRGEVKSLRLYSFTYAYPGVGGLYGSIGMDGPWDMRRILGTAPVAPDGSVAVRIPANTPIAVQPLDGEGKALQLMRSWFAAMPGETVTCVGCHERLNDTPSLGATANLNRTPAEIEPWRGPQRNFEFAREVQPVLDRFCVGCHDGRTQSPDLRGTAMLTGWSTLMAGNTGPGSGGKFSLAYANLHRYVRRPGIESPMPMQTPMEFHADTTELVQLLLKGHHNVELDSEAWDRLITWIDFNAPYHGRWSTIVGEDAAALEERRAALRACYAKVEENHEALPQAPVPLSAPVLPRPEAPRPAALAIPGWPLAPGEARRLQDAAGKQPLRIDLGEGMAMEFAFIPPGTFAMGSVTGYPDEFPMSAVRIGRGFWMAKTEVTNRQFRQFDPAHDSREEDRHGYQFGIPGYTVDEPDMPAVRLSWTEAAAFCEWLSGKSGRRAALPTEAQWEWACRAGSDTPFSHGGLDSDFSPFANLGDATLADFSGNPYTVDRVKARYNNPDNPFDNWIPQDSRFNDGGFVSEPVGSYKPNAWGVCDMHGNVAEWTSSPYLPYPYTEAAAGKGQVKRVVRGGSWYDRPKRCTSSYRFGYREYQKVFNVGFRVVIAE